MAKSYPHMSKPAQDAEPLYSAWGRDPLVLINTCFILVTIGQVSLHFLLGTFLLSTRVRPRNATLYNLLIVTVVASIPPGLLYYSGHVMDEKPPAGLCILQAVLKHGTDPMFVVAASALILETLFDIGLLVTRIKTRTQVRLLVALPYMVFFLFAVLAAILAATNTACVKHKPNELYCTITYHQFGETIEILCVVITTFTISLEIYTVIFFRGMWRGVPEASRGLVQEHRKEPPTLRIVCALRLVGFTCLQLFYFVLLGLGFWVGSVARYIIPNIYKSLIPLTTFLIFGSTLDCMSTWKSWILWWRPKLETPRSTLVDRTANGSPETLNMPICPEGEPSHDNVRIADLDVPSVSPAVNEAKAHGEELPVIHIC